MSSFKNFINELFLNFFEIVGKSTDWDLGLTSDVRVAKFGEIYTVRYAVNRKRLEASVLYVITNVNTFVPPSTLSLHTYSKS